MRMSELWADLLRANQHVDLLEQPKEPEPVLTLRDQFAIAALPHFIGKTNNDDDAADAAVMAYIYADAMMKERQWKPEPEDE